MAGWNRGQHYAFQRAIAPPRALPLASSAPVGLDAERIGVERGLWPQICLPPEIDWLESQPERLRRPPPRSSSAPRKPSTNVYVGPRRVARVPRVAIKFTEPKVAENGTFLAELLAQGRMPYSAERALAGAFRVDGEFVMTGLALMACG